MGKTIPSTASANSRGIPMKTRHRNTKMIANIHSVIIQLTTILPCLSMISDSSFLTYHSTMGTTNPANGTRKPQNWDRWINIPHVFVLIASIAPLDFSSGGCYSDGRFFANMDSLASWYSCSEIAPLCLNPSSFSISSTKLMWLSPFNWLDTPSYATAMLVSTNLSPSEPPEKISSVFICVHPWFSLFLWFLKTDTWKFWTAILNEIRVCYRSSLIILLVLKSP